MHCCTGLLLDTKRSSGVSLVWASVREIQGNGLCCVKKMRFKLIILFFFIYSSIHTPLWPWATHSSGYRTDAQEELMKLCASNRSLLIQSLLNTPLIRERASPDPKHEEVQIFNRLYITPQTQFKPKVTPSTNQHSQNISLLILNPIKRVYYQKKFWCLKKYTFHSKRTWCLSQWGIWESCGQMRAGQPHIRSVTTFKLILWFENKTVPKTFS